MIYTSMHNKEHLNHQKIDNKGNEKLIQVFEEPNLIAATENKPKKVYKGCTHTGVGRTQFDRKYEMADTRVCAATEKKPKIVTKVAI